MPAFAPAADALADVGEHARAGGEMAAAPPV